MFPYMMIQRMTMPRIPTDYDIPPTIYTILNSIVNYGKEEKTKIKDLAKTGRVKIFDFDYPLSNHITKEDFECMILKHYMMRRIGFDTVTAFKLALDVKLNEIMPTYNLMFDSLLNWNLFEDGEKTTRETIDSRITNTESNVENKTNSKSYDSLITDSRNSDTPENQIEDVKNGSYVSEYSYNQNNETNESNADTTSKSNGLSNDNGRVNETITRTPSDKMAIYKNFLESKQNIYSMIFKDLDSLFYQIV